MKQRNVSRRSDRPPLFAYSSYSARPSYRCRRLWRDHVDPALTACSLHRGGSVRYRVTFPVPTSPSACVFDPQPSRRDGSYGRIEPMIFSTETLSLIMRCLTAAAYHVRYQRVASATSGAASAP